MSDDRTISVRNKIIYFNLIKVVCPQVAVDRNYHPTCPKVLYRASGDQNLFPKTHLDPVDQNHVYVPFKNQVLKSVFLHTVSSGDVAALKKNLLCFVSD